MSADDVAVWGAREDNLIVCDSPDIKSTGASILCFLTACVNPEEWHEEEGF